ncbi:MAG: hypothetical protein ACOY41_03940 [Pseudomonadota bacterium]
MAKQRPLDDLGPDFERRWKQAPQDDRRAVLAELRDLYAMLERDDALLLAKLGVIRRAATALAEEEFPVLAFETAPAGRSASQGSLFNAAPAAAAPASPPRKENPFLPRSVLDRLQQSQSQVSAGLRDLMQDQELVDKSLAAPLTPRQAQLERELRLRLGPIVEGLVEAQIERLKSELRLRLRAEMDQLIAEHVRRQG